MSTPTQLSPEREAELRAMRAKVHQLLPDMLPFLQELSDLGMVPGWRCLRRVRALTDPEWPPEIAIGNLLTGKEFAEYRPKEMTP